MSDEEILKEAIKNSKMKRFLKFEEDENKYKKDGNEFNKDNFYSNDNDNENYKDKDKEKEKEKEKEIINKRFNELRKKHKNLSVDAEAEEHIQKLRNIGEYNRWSLKLIQKYLTMFYQGIKLMKIKLKKN
jgi:hypothetical protein